MKALRMCHSHKQLTKLADCNVPICSQVYALWHQIFILDVGMEKEQKQELGWRVPVLPVPALHHCEPLCVACTQYTVECRNG